MHLCPFCGHELEHVVKEGIGSCCNCKRVFDNNPFARLLSAGWMVRKEHLTETKRLKAHGFKEDEALVAIMFCYDNSYSHEEYVKALENIGISKTHLYAEE